MTPDVLTDGVKANNEKKLKTGRLAGFAIGSTVILCNHKIAISDQLKSLFHNRWG